MSAERDKARKVSHGESSKESQPLGLELTELRKFPTRELHPQRLIALVELQLQWEVEMSKGPKPNVLGYLEHPS